MHELQQSEHVLFRPMQKGDVERVAELERICFRTPWSRAALAGELKNDVAHYLVGECDGRVIAYAGMWVLFDEAHITNVAVDPAFRRRGTRPAADALHDAHSAPVRRSHDDA